MSISKSLNFIIFAILLIPLGSHAYPNLQQASLSKVNLAKYLKDNKNRLNLSDDVYVCKNFALIKTLDENKYILAGDLPEAYFDWQMNAWNNPPVVSLESRIKDTLVLKMTGRNYKEIWGMTLGMPAYKGRIDIYYRLKFNLKDPKQLEIERRVWVGSQVIEASWEWKDLFYQILFKGTCLNSKLDTYLEGLSNP